MSRPPQDRKRSRSHNPQSSSEQFALSATVAFGLFALPNLLAALYTPIADCDETFNYWEPAHYLSHGYGLQTWEYSPAFAIRSWTYVSLHAVVGRIAFFLTGDKVLEFYSIRVALALVCSFCQARFFVAISNVLNARVAIMFMIAMLTSPGAFMASVAYLPSSFSMYANMLGAVAFMDWRKGPKTANGIMWFAVGGLIGWPFAAVLIVPFFIEELVLTASTGEWVALIKRCVDGGLRSVGILALQAFVELFFYHKVVVIPWNLVSYNIFSGPGRGPDIFGTEPFDFYLRNLLLNFNLWFILALSSAPVLLLQHFFGRSSNPKIWRSLVFVSPFYLLLGIFSLQAHKEERFMYPAYPFLGLSAAIALHAVLGWFGNADPRSVLGKIPPQLKFLVVASGIIGAIGLGVLRTIGNIQAYQAPLQVYQHLYHADSIGSNSSVCTGKEWYRFTASYFLPEDMRARFVKSEFTGLLPGQFDETPEGSGILPRTWIVPGGMNDLNIADSSKHIDISRCDYLVDLRLPSTTPTAKEPDYIADSTTWEKVYCEPFLDAASTTFVPRLLWAPSSPLIPNKLQRQWGDYCLLRRRVSV